MKDAELEALRAELEPRWQDVRRRAVLERALAARRRARGGAGANRRWTPVVTGIVAVAAAVVIGVVTFGRDSEEAPLARPQPPPADRVPAASVAPPERSLMNIADGSTALLATGAALEVVVQTAEHVQLRQTAGAVRYRVVRNPERLFEVDANGVRVTVVGTEFDIELDAERARVAVVEGRVRLDDSTREIELGAGEALEVSLPSAQRAPSPRDPEPEPTREAAEPVSLQALEASADEARRQGRHDEAAAILERLVALDPRGRGEAALFTLGSIRGAQGRHSLAARYYERYRARFPEGALVEDALAAEAVHTAELDPARAARLAEQYLAQYPDGTHRREVELLLDQ